MAQPDVAVSGTPTAGLPAGSFVTPQGLTMTPAVSSVVPVSQITPQTPLGVTNPPPAADLAGGIVAGAGQTVKDTAAYIKENTPPQTATDLSAEKLRTDTAALYDTVKGKTAALATAEVDAGVPTLNKTLADINAQILSQTAERNKINAGFGEAAATAEGRNVTKNSYIGEAAQIERQRMAADNNKAASIGLLQAQALGLQGQITAAKENAARAVDLKYSSTLEEIAIKEKQLELIKPTLDKEEKIAAAALSQKLAEQKSATEAKKANEKQLNDLRLEMSMKYQGAGITMTDTVPQINEKIKATQQYKTEQAKVVLENAKIQADILKTKNEAGANVAPVPTEYQTVVSTAAGLLGAAKVGPSKAAISNALAGKDYAGAYALIANNVEDSLTGSNKTKFADTRTDYGVMSGMREAIQAYAAGGGKMSFLTGTEEDIKRKLGIDSGKASVLATQLWREFQSYRLAMTGAAFSPSESRDYAAVNPTLGKSLDLNLSVIDGALAQLKNRITSTVEQRVPGSSKIYSLAAGTEPNDEASSKLRVTDYVKSNPAYLSTVNKAFTDNPTWSYSDVLSLLRATVPNFQ